MSNQLKSAEMHIKIRWVGVPFLITGLFILITATLHLSGPGGSWFTLLLGVASSLGSLTVFGVNHDTAVALGIELANSTNSRSTDVQQATAFSDFEKQATPQLCNEVFAELKRNRTEALSLRPSPKSALLIPIIVLGVQIFASWRLFA